MTSNARRGIACWVAGTLGLVGCHQRVAATSGEVIQAETLGSIFLEEDKLPEAVEQFTKLIAMAPGDLTGRLGLAQSYLKMGRLREAEKSIARAVELAPTSLEARLLRVKLYRVTDRGALAHEELQRLRRSSPADPKILYALVELARETDPARDGAPEAHTYLRDLDSLLPGNIPVRVELAQALAARADADGAIGELEALRQLPPELPREARPSFDEALRALRAGDSTSARTSLAKLHRSLEATPQFQRALNILRGPEGPLAGRSDFTYAGLDAMADRLRRDTTPIQVRFVEGMSWGATLPGGRSPALATADYKGDRSLDILLTGAGGGALDPLARLVHWEFGRPWVDEAAKAGIAVASPVAAGFADYDNDGRLDLYIADSRGNGHLYRNRGDGRFEDVTAKAGVATPGGVRRILFADLDHDGDLDLFLVTEAGNRFYRNNGDGTFRELTRQSGLSGGLGGRDGAFADLDGDALLDLIVAGDSGVTIYHNAGQGRFEDRTVASGLGRGAATAIAVADYDNDGFFDLFIAPAVGGTPSLYRGEGDGKFTADRRSVAALEVTGSLTSRRAVFFDYDNDGRLDLLIVGEPADSTGRPAFLLHNDTDRGFIDSRTVLPANLPAIRDVVVADLDQDRDLDLLIAGPTGTRLLRNEGGNRNLALQVKLTGLGTGSGKNNSFGIGARLEVRAGDLYQSRVVTDPTTLFGMGRRLKVDVLRVEWPNGVPQSIYLPGTDQDVVEQQILKSSCAFLYTWTGERYEFLTDAMWQSALGMPVAIGGSGTTKYAPPGASREYIKIPGGGLLPNGNRYRIQWTEELWETSYTDQVELLAVDHPDSVEILVDERFPPIRPADPLALYRVRGRRPPLSAVNERGTNVLPALLAADHRYVADLTPERYQGVTTTHDLVLDLGELPARPLLLLRGWIFPTDASINQALSQSQRLRVAPPSMDVQDDAGRWHPAVTNLGFPAGKDKTIVVDLRSKFAGRTHRIRVRTNMQIYWDQVSVASELPGGVGRITRLRPTAADLHYRGFSRMYQKGGRYGPHWFVYDEVSREPVWRPIGGKFTRYGDVRALLEAADDEYIVMAPGDEATLEFDAAAAPAVPAGWTRDFLWYSVGWIKDADLNTARGGTVEPLPFHRMTEYPYGPEQRYPTDSAHRRYLEQYNTRRSRPPAKHSEACRAGGRECVDAGSVGTDRISGVDEPNDRRYEHPRGMAGSPRPARPR